MGKYTISFTSLQFKTFSQLSDLCLCDMCAFMCVCMCMVYVFVCLSAQYVCMCIHMCKHIVHVCLHTCLCIFCVWMCGCAYVHVCLCVFIFACNTSACVPLDIETGQCLGSAPSSYTSLLSWFFIVFILFKREFQFWFFISLSRIGDWT